MPQQALQGTNWIWAQWCLGTDPLWARVTGCTLYAVDKVQGWEPGPLRWGVGVGWPLFSSLSKPSIAMNTEIVNKIMICTILGLFLALLHLKSDVFYA